MADQYGFYGDVSYADEYLHRYRPYNRSTGMNGLGSTVTSGNYRGALGRVHYGQRPTSRGSDFAMMRGLGMTPAGPRMGGLGDGFGDAAADRALCASMAALGQAVIGAVVTGTRPPDLQEFRADGTRQHSAEQIAYRQRQQADFDRAARVVAAAGGVVPAFCNFIPGTVTPAPGSTGPSAWEIEAARQRFQAEAAGSSKKMMQMALLVGGGVAAAAAVYFLVK